MNETITRGLEPRGTGRPGSLSRLLRILLLLLATGSLLACGGSDDDDNDGGSSTPGNFAGTWSISEVVDASDCGEGIYTTTYSITVTQSGSSISVVTPVGTFSGTVSGNSLSWTGSYPEDGGTTTIDSLTGNLSGSTISGTSSWSWTDGAFSCSGTTTWTGTRTSGGGSASPEVEPNDTLGNATPIFLTSGTAAFSGTVNSSTDEFDYYTFTPLSSGSYTFTLDGFDTVQHDLDLAIANSSLTVLGTSLSTDSHESITLSLTGGALYYIEVSAWSTTGDGPYTLTVNQN